MPAMNAAIDGPSADLRYRKRKAVKRTLFTLQAILQEDEITDESLDRAIALLTEARRATLTQRPPSAPKGPPASRSASQSRSVAQSRSAIQEAPRFEQRISRTASHHRHASDQYEQLTLWMRLRHASKPPKGYRVQYEGAWSTVTLLGGIQASSIHPNASRGFSDDKLCQLVTNHLDWNAAGSPFISLFTDESHAADWALKWSERNGGKPCQLLYIDCSKVTRLFSVKDVVNCLRVHTSLSPEQYADEWMAVNQIPADAISNSREIRCPVPEVFESQLNQSHPSKSPPSHLSKSPPSDPSHVWTAC
jgi:hypothetical protein